MCWRKAEREREFDIKLLKNDKATTKQSKTTAKNNKKKRRKKKKKDDSRLARNKMCVGVNEMTKFKVRPDPYNRKIKCVCD